MGDWTLGLVGAGWEGDEAILLRQGYGDRALLQDFFFSLSRPGFGNQDWALLSTLLPASFSLPHFTLPREAPRLTFSI